VKLLHTADWHLGKILKGHNRLDEQRSVLAEMVSVVEREQVDVVLVAGDVFDISGPAPDAQNLAWSTLLAFRAAGAEVVVVAGNHDSPDSFDALAPLFAAAGVTVIGRPRSPAAGGVLRLDVGRGREPLRLALLPFVSQRGAVRAADLLHLDAAQAQGQYADRLRGVIERLTEGFTGDAANVVLGHATITGAGFGGGEREAHSVFDYHLPALVFPPVAGYVALGHLHRQQLVPGPCPIWYAGSPIVVDFGETENRGGALLVTVEAGRPARVEPVEFASARRLVTITGTVEQLIAYAPGIPDGALVRAIVTEPARTGLADEVRSAVANVLEVRIERPTAAIAKSYESREGRSPSELFRQYLDSKSVADPAVENLFAELLDEVQPGASDGATSDAGRLF
jgi:DNA repair protein SbcD/Mre11